MRYSLKKTAALTCTAFLCLSLAGCGGLKDAYSFDGRTEAMTASIHQGEHAGLFAQKLCVISNDASNDKTQLDAKAGALFDVTDSSVLYSQNAYDKIYPASITKVMTAILAIEDGTLSDEVTVTDASVITEPGASLCGIKPGDKLTLDQLLYGLLLPSGNDAADAIAVHMSGSVDAFVKKMNEKAKELGATHTNFMNPNGLSNDNHYTTAYDLYLIFNEALKLPQFKKIIGTDSFTANYKNGAGEDVTKIWTVGNLYQKGTRKPPDGVKVLGGKTGTTQAAGYCLIQAEDDAKGKEYISVVLGADSREALYDNMTNVISKIVN